MVVLVGVAVGTLFGYRGSSIVTEGDGFSNVLTQYDEFGSGIAVQHRRPAAVLTQRSTTSPRSSSRSAAPRPERRGCSAQSGTYVSEARRRRRSRSTSRSTTRSSIDGTSVYLVGQGYAPVIRVTDAKGDVVFEDAVPFLPTDPSYTSNGVVKVPGAEPEQLGFQGFFLPTAISGDDGVSISAFPGAANPLLGLFVWHGDLGLDDGLPQSVYVLDKTKMKQYLGPNGKGFRISLSRGQETDLPDGGTIEFVELRQFVRFQFSSSPLVKVPLFGIVAGLLGLMISLSVKPRRTWIRARRDGSRTVVDVAALDRVPRDDLPADLDAFLTRFRQASDRGEAHDPGAARPVLELCDRLGDRCPGARLRRVRRAVELRPQRRAGPRARLRRSTAVDRRPRAARRRAQQPGWRHRLLAHRRWPQPSCSPASSTRGLAAERVPWGNMYEFGCAAILVALTAYIVLVRVWSIDWVGPIITGFGTVVLGASMLVYVPAGPLVPALHSYWLVIHVLGAMIAGAAFLVGAAASVLYLVKSRAERNDAGGRACRLPLEHPGVGAHRPGRLPRARVRVPDLDVRGADRRPDLGAVLLGSLLGLGPQGGLGVHHLGRLRRLPPRPRHRGLEGQGGRDRRADRLRHIRVQLRRRQPVRAQVSTRTPSRAGARLVPRRSLPVCALALAPGPAARCARPRFPRVATWARVVPWG